MIYDIFTYLLKTSSLYVLKPRTLTVFEKYLTKRYLLITAETKNTYLGLKQFKF